MKFIYISSYNFYFSRKHNFIFCYIWYTLDIHFILYQVILFYNTWLIHVHTHIIHTFLGSFIVMHPEADIIHTWRYIFFDFPWGRRVDV